MSLRFKDSAKGITLVELLIASSIGIAAGVLLIGIFARNNNILFFEQSTILQGLELNDTVSKLDNDIKIATAVSLGYPEQSSQYSSSDQVLVLKLNSIDSNFDIIDETYDYIVVAADSANPLVLRELQFVDPLSSRKPFNHVLATKLSKVQFKYLDSTGNEVSPTLASTVLYTINLKVKDGVSVRESSSSGRVNLKNN